MSSVFFGGDAITWIDVVIAFLVLFAFFVSERDLAKGDSQMKQTEFCIDQRVHAALITAVTDSLAILPNEIPWQTPLRLWITDSLDRTDVAFRVERAMSIHTSDGELIERCFDACKEGNLLDVQKKIVSAIRIAL